MDFKEEIPKFVGQLNLNEFIDWMNTIERVFKYKDVLDDKNLKLTASKLCEYASF